MVFHTFSSEIEAKMAQKQLEESGVESFVFKDDAGGMEPHLQRTNGVRLVGRRSDADQVKRILGG
jgi:hypothetical protein